MNGKTSGKGDRLDSTIALVRDMESLTFKSESI